jgi:hypothetical protein
VIDWCTGDQQSPRDPQQAVDEAWKLLVDLFFATPPRSREELISGIWEAQAILFSASSQYGRKRGQPRTMRPIAVRAYVIRKFNPHPTKADESSVSWAKLADLLFLENGKCPRKIRDEDGTTVCRVARHQYNSPCVKALITAVSHLHSAIKHDRIPV